MLKVGKDDLEKLIDEMKSDLEINGENEHNSIQKNLKNTIKNLCLYNEKMIKEISEKVMEEPKKLYMGEIVNGLISESKQEEYPELFSELELDSEMEYPVFIDEDYEKVREIIGDTSEEDVLYEGSYIYKGEQHKFKYKIKFNNEFIKKENIIKKLDIYYDLNNSVVFSPFGRKAVNVVLMEDIPEDVHLDYQFKLNGLNIVKDKILAWNLNITETDYKICNGKVPYGDEIKYHFIIEKSPNDNWYYILPENNQTLVYDVKFTENGTEIWTDHEIERFQLIEWNNVDRDRLEIKNLLLENNLFFNYIEKTNFICNKIRTLGDVQYAIRPFRKNMDIICGISDGKGIPFLRYSIKYRNDMQIGMRTLRESFLKFEFLQQFKYKNDYVNYVLSYLEYYYPEIEWIGER